MIFQFDRAKYKNQNGKGEKIMKIHVVGKLHLKGTSKKTGNPYDFIQVHYLGKAPGVEGNAALTLNLDPKDHPFDGIKVPGDYIADFDGKGFIVDFYPVPAAVPGK